MLANYDFFYIFLQVGDQIMAVNGNQMENIQYSEVNFSRFFRQNKDKLIYIENGKIVLYIHD